MKLMFLRSLAPAAALFALPGLTQAASEANPAAVKTYLQKTVKTMDEASAEFVKNAKLYQELIASHQGDYAAAYQADPKAFAALVEKLRENYKAMDSFGYETVEGIVAGVSSLADFDVYLDSGVPKSMAGATTPAAPVTLKLANGQTIDQQGCLFTYLIEPMLWGGNPEWCVPVDLNGDGKIAPRESVPRVEVLMACAVDVHKKIDELVDASTAWQPTAKDCFDAVITMTPTLSGYFEDWKESRYDTKKSGLFTAVSRVSDMRGIMSSVQVLYSAVDPLVQEKDQALSKSIGAGFKNIMSFVDRVGQREKASGAKLTVAEIDEMAHQATEKSDKIVPQVEQAAALVEAKKG